MGGNTPIADVVDAPTIGTATAGTEAATVAYTAAATGGAATSFTAISTPGSITGTGVSPITVSGLTGGTAYTFKVYGTNASGVWSGVQSAASNSVTPAIATAFESISTTTLASSTGTVTFSSIPSGYKALQIRAIARSTFGNNTGDQVTIQVNGITASSYSYRHIGANGSSVDVNGFGTQTTMGLGYAPNDGTTANVFGAFIIDVLDYTSTSKFKTFNAFGGYDSSGQGTLRLQSGLFQSTNAVTSISLTHNTFKAGSIFSLYGVK